jgi:hypothetical protein
MRENEKKQYEEITTKNFPQLLKDANSQFGENS